MSLNWSTFSILHINFSKTLTSNYLFYILFYVNNHFSLFVYYYPHRERERERERERIWWDKRQEKKREDKIMIYKVRAFASTRAKIHIYFNTRIYFFLIYILTFKTIHIKFSILHYISLKYKFFFFFFNCSLSSHIITITHSLPSFSRYVKK